MIAIRVRLQSATLIGLALAGAVPVSAQSEQPAAAPDAVVRLAAATAGAIYGAVLDERGEPVEGAVISALGSSTAFAVTDEAGKYRISDLPAGPYVVRVHRDGYGGTRSTLVNVRPASKASSSFTLKREPTTVATAGVGQVEALPRDESAVAWRLRRLTRSVLKDDQTAVEFADVDAAWLGAEAPSFLQRAVDVSARLASSMLTWPLNGQVNLLTATAYDDTGEMVAFGPSAGLAFFAVGAPVGDRGDWVARAAMNGGDMSSWTMAADYTPREAARHQISFAAAYSVQAYHGGNVAALQAMSEGQRKAGAVSVSHEVSPARRWRLGYGARYQHYDYLDGHGLLSPAARLTFAPSDGWQLHAKAALQQVAPGAEEFVAPSRAEWMPAQRTFAPLGGNAFAVERVQHYEVGATRQFRDTSFTVRAFEQLVDDQLVAVFGAADPAGLVAAGGHYGIASAGDARMRGWAAGLRHDITPHVHGRLDYTVVSTRWSAAADADLRALAARAPQALRPEHERVHDVSASVDAEVPQTATRFVMLYKVNTGFVESVPGLQTARGRFDVQFRQGLPFMDGLGDWEMLVGVRSLFRPSLEDRSIYDELLVVRAPKRVVGGLQVRF